MEENKTQNTAILSSLKGHLMEGSGVQTQSRGKDGHVRGDREATQGRERPHVGRMKSA